MSQFEMPDAPLPLELESLEFLPKPFHDLYDLDYRGKRVLGRIFSGDRVSYLAYVDHIAGKSSRKIEQVDDGWTRERVQEEERQRAEMQAAAKEELAALEQRAADRRRAEFDAQAAERRRQFEAAEERRKQSYR